VLPPDLAPVDWSIMVVDVGSGVTLAGSARRSGPPVER
jgi:hypothetical protein